MTPFTPRTLPPPSDPYDPHHTTHESSQASPTLSQPFCSDPPADTNGLSPTSSMSTILTDPIESQYQTNTMTNDMYDIESMDHDDLTSFQQKLPEITPPTQFIYLSTWNIKSMHASKWGKRKYKWLTEEDDTGWLQRHDIAVITDTKLSSLDIPRRRTPYFKGYYETHACHSSGDKIWGCPFSHERGALIQWKLTSQPNGPSPTHWMADYVLTSSDW